MPPFKINEGIYWLEARTEMGRDELQFVLDQINTEKNSDEGKFLDEREIHRFGLCDKRKVTHLLLNGDNDKKNKAFLKERIDKVQALLLEWIKQGYRIHHFSTATGKSNPVPHFMIIDDGDGRLETTGGRDTVFYEVTKDNGSSYWQIDAGQNWLIDVLNCSEKPAFSTLNGMSLFRLKAAYLKSVWRTDLLTFTDMAAYVETLGTISDSAILLQDEQFIRNWFLQNRKNWVKAGDNGRIDAFQFKAGVSLLLEMGHFGGSGAVIGALNELIPDEWRLLFRDPEFSVNLPVRLAEMHLSNPLLFDRLTPKTAEASLVFSAARARSTRTTRSDKLEEALTRLEAALEQGRRPPDKIYPGELLIAVTGIKDLLGYHSDFTPPDDLVNRLYHFISEFVTVAKENMELPTIPSPVSNEIFDEERWVKGKVMDINLKLMTDAFDALEMAGKDRRELHAQMKKRGESGKSPADPYDVLTAYTMILHSELPQVQRSDAYVQFYKRVLARQMLARRRGKGALVKNLNRLQVMNQIGRELERMFWGNSGFRESLLAGHEERLNRQLKANLDSRDEILGRNFLPLAIIRYLYRAFVTDKKEEVRAVYHEDPSGNQRPDPLELAWEDIGRKLDNKELDLGDIVRNRLENSAYGDEDQSDFTEFLRAGRDTAAFQRILKWCEGREDELPFPVFWQNLNDTDFFDYPVGEKDARAQGIAATFILRSWSSGVSGRIENYFKAVDEGGPFSTTEKMSFLEGFAQSDLRHVAPQYLFRFFTDPNEMVRRRAFEIYRDLGYPDVVARYLIGRKFGFKAEAYLAPDSFMAALDGLKLDTEVGGMIEKRPLRESTREVIGDIVGDTSGKNTARRFLRKHRRFERRVLEKPGHEHRHGAPTVQTEEWKKRKFGDLLEPDPDRPRAYRGIAHDLADTGDRTVIPVLIQAYLADAPVTVGNRPLRPLMPFYDFVISLACQGKRSQVEEGLVATISHSENKGFLAKLKGKAVPLLLMEWGKENDVDVILAFRKAMFEYDAGKNIQIEQRHLELEGEKGKHRPDPARIDQLESELIHLYAEELLRTKRENPEALDQLIASIYNEARRQYLLGELKRFGVVAVQELVDQIEILSKKVGDEAIAPAEREKYQIQREQLLAVLLAIQ